MPGENCVFSHPSGFFVPAAPLKPAAAALVSVSVSDSNPTSGLERTSHFFPKTQTCRNISLCSGHDDAGCLLDLGALSRTSCRVTLEQMQQVTLSSVLEPLRFT